MEKYGCKLVGKSDIDSENFAVCAMQELQKEMTEEAERTGLTSEEIINKIVADMRNETEDVL